MLTSLTAEALLAAIERRLARISTQLHALSAERAKLQDQTVRLRMGAITPEAVLLDLKTRGVALSGVGIRTTREKPARPACPAPGRNGGGGG